MRIAVVGAGPAGLYFATLWRKRHPGDEVTVYEQNPAGATFGFGVVFSDRAPDFLRADDPETADLITPRMETWQDITPVHRGERIAIDGVGFSAIGRLAFLRLLEARARAVGVEPRYGAPVRLDALGGFDLVVGADGVNSTVRGALAAELGTALSHLANRFVWYGTTKRFETLSQTFVETGLGTFNAHHYRYAPGMSTFIVECDPETWTRAGFDRTGPEETRAICEAAFADTLEGHALVSNKSVWRAFPFVANARWSQGNRVLIGDALHTAHFSIGSGTRLALEDAIALAAALAEAPNDLREGLARYEAARRPVADKLVAASRASAAWYERFPAHMRLEPLDFAMSYLTRSGRLDDERLRALSPRFMARYAARAGSPNGGPQLSSC